MIGPVGLRVSRSDVSSCIERSCASVSPSFGHARALTRLEIEQRESARCIAAAITATSSAVRLFRMTRAEAPDKKPTTLSLSSMPTTQSDHSASALTWMLQTPKGSPASRNASRCLPSAAPKTRSPISRCGVSLAAPFKRTRLASPMKNGSRNAIAIHLPGGIVSPRTSVPFVLSRSFTHAEPFCTRTARCFLDMSGQRTCASTLMPRPSVSSPRSREPPRSSCPR